MKLKPSKRTVHNKRCARHRHLRNYGGWIRLDNAGTYTFTARTDDCILVPGDYITISSGDTTADGMYKVTLSTGNEPKFKNPNKVHPARRNKVLKRNRLKEMTESGRVVISAGSETVTALKVSPDSWVIEGAITI